MSSAPFVLVRIRGQQYRVTEITAFEDRSVGIGWHVEDFRLIDDKGAEVPGEFYDSLSDPEFRLIDDAVYAAQAEYEGDV